MELGADSSSVRELSSNPVMLAEARRALHPIRVVATTPAGEEGVRRVIGRRLVTFPVQKMSEGEWAAWWQERYDVLADLPEVALEAGMAAWVRDPNAEFLPKPGKLRELALNTPNRATRAYERITAAVRDVQEWEQPKPRVTKAQVDEMLKGFRTQMAERKAQAKPEPPPVQGPIDGGGLTPHMRRFLEERDQ